MTTVLYERKNGISYVTLNRPKAYNAMNEAMIKELHIISKQIKENDDRFVIVSGEGPAFSAGGDVQMMAKGHSVKEMETMMDTIKELVLNWYHLNKIVISAVAGPCAGLGLSFALNADFVIAHDKAKFGMLFAGVGFVPDGGGHFFLERKLGSEQAKKFIWSMEQIEAKKAKEIGLIDEVTSDDPVQVAEAYVKKMSQLPFEAVISTKEIYQKVENDRLSAILDEEKVKQTYLSQTDNHREGVQAFIEKRSPKFK